MNVFYLAWNSLRDEDMCIAFEEAGHTVVKIPYDGMKVSQEEVLGLIKENIGKIQCDFVFSFQYFPAVSNCCTELNIKYVSWVYDNTGIEVYSQTVLNPCNYMFVFDYAMYAEFRNSGINTVYYMPMAVKQTQRDEKFVDDIAILDSVYTEEKQQRYNGLEVLDSFTRGYLDGLIQSQKNVREYNFLEQALLPQIVTALEKVYPIETNDTLLEPEAFYANQVLNPRITALERQDILQILNEQYNIKNYGYNGQTRPAKINLNISDRATRSGIPWLALEIMAQGGFLISNYQQELFEYFEADKDFVCYYNQDDLLQKVDYYMEHDDERKQIAKSGWEKVHADHALWKRIQEMLEVLSEEETE